jgi:phosphate transport system permease protein
MNRDEVRRVADKLSFITLSGLTIGFNCLFIAIIALLYVRSSGVFDHSSLWSIVFQTEWLPSGGKFGMLNFIKGTMLVTLLSIVMAAPVSILTAVFLAEYAPRSMTSISKTVIDVFAGIPSVVYGMWGVLFVVPFISYVSSAFFGQQSTGYSLISASIVLAIMIFPLIANIVTELIESVPAGLKEASFSLGATRWQTVKHVVLKRIRPGIIAAVVLGLSRAFGETMAVMMLAGNVAKMPESIFDPVYTISALIANNYGEMMSVPMYDSALMFASLILLVVVIVFNSTAQLILYKTIRKGAK